MAKLRYGSPWALGAAGVGEGLLEGYMVGSEISDRRQRRQREEKQMEQERLREALSLLQTGIKSGDPAVMQSLAPLIQSAYPGFQMPQMKTELDKNFDVYQQAKAKGLSDAEAKAYAFSLKPGTDEKPIAFFTPQGAYVGHFAPTQAPPGTTPKIWRPDKPEATPWTFDAQGRPTPLPDNYSKKGYITPFKPPGGGKPEFASPKLPVELGKLEAIIKDPKSTPEAREAAIRSYQQYGGKVKEMSQGYRKGTLWDTAPSPYYSVARPDVKIKGVGGQTPGPWQAAQEDDEWEYE